MGNLFNVIIWDEPSKFSLLLQSYKSRLLSSAPLKRLSRFPKTNPFLKKYNAFFDFLLCLRLQSRAYFFYLANSRYIFQRYITFRRLFFPFFTIALGTYMYNWPIFLMRRFPIDERTFQKLTLFANDAESANYSTKRRFLDENIEKGGDCDLVSWIAFANLFNDEPELAYHAFHIAHLTDHRKIKPNSDLIFEIGIENEGQKSEEEKNIDKILRNLQ